MHPINKKHFGPEAGKLAVTFHNGTQVVTGHVVKQLGVNKFRVSDGTVTKDIILAPTDEIAAAPTGNYGSFAVTTTAGTKFARKITSTRAITLDGQAVSWTAGLVEQGKGAFARVGDVVSEAAGRIVVDFKNGIYTVDGVATTVGALIEEFIDEGPWNPAEIVNGTGLVGTTYNVGSLNTTAAAPLFANGFIAVVTYQLVNGEGTKLIEIARMDGDYVPYQALTLQGGDPLLAQMQSDVGNIDENTAQTALFKTAARFSNATVSISTNGAAVVSGAAAATVDDEPTTRILIYSMAQSAGGTSIIERIEFYPVTDYTDGQFPTLSAIA